jgi:hypothetical protein
MEERGQWESRTSFVLAAIGSAIGRGNIWRFPYRVPRNGYRRKIWPAVIIFRDLRFFSV